ncbi:molecular chaperone DnaJ [Amycolatopsis suaedae]|uniref:Molecular chaperone DnaJ n=1 Tax=Amycolatopsis suaedae TaxID=2510978 RepID=A0A4Q7IZF7_9PSEU|nr:molecular chaperone DnaJ [Amycolatopsis suaedae]RZQ59818.1 molecular chaperone DnaJ [Amycolatopsis suaedae]
MPDLRYQIEPMRSWPYPAGAPRPSPFRATWSDTLALLGRELDYLDVQGAVALRVVTTDADVRQDGMLRANAKVHHRGVILSFQSKHGPLSYPCATYTNRWSRDPAGSPWQVNVRAIALALEALRKVDRYGVTSSGEQYSGWRAIEGAATTGFDSADDALQWLIKFADMPDRDGVDPAVREAVPVMLRRAVRKAHPDVGGDPADWARLDAARQLLDPRGGVP